LVLLARFAFQACSFNHSDISPFDSLRSLRTGRFRINELRSVRNSVAQNSPSNRAVRRCDFDSAVYRRALWHPENCVRPPNVIRSLTVISTCLSVSINAAIARRRVTTRIIETGERLGLIADEVKPPASASLQPAVRPP